MADGKIARAGLVATNSIRGGRSRAVLGHIVEDSMIYHAWSDEPWVVDGAAVRVSLVCFASQGAGLPLHLNGKSVSHINADLTSDPADLTLAGKLPRSLHTAFMGDKKNGPFDIAGDLARTWLAATGQSQRKTEFRCPEALGERHGFDPPPIWQVDHRLRL